MYIAGVDEVGRGAWAGPLVAAAVILNNPIKGLKDSKRLSALIRLSLSDEIKQKSLSWAIAEIPSHEIDQMGLAEANKLVMRMAIDQLRVVPDLVRIDGFSCATHVEEEVYVKGDALFAEISAASIIAKVHRDKLMAQFHNHYPQYGFDKHVGYGTRLHHKALQAHGACEIHRLSFKPLQNLTK